ncbi:restriction endonuclease subunit S [Sphingobacterium sp. ML3W]|uniref:restriction endonuclease subunit S n=1 Tax=Sphingobacterium sp. ML3W TaxID=1538644 RepID=UPI00068C8DFF|nr:restriction endonuclease subunit S [Sphingobacterium sp. ML3W]
MNNIPEIRFPEFEKDREWEKHTIGTKFNLQDGFPFSSYDFTENGEDTMQVIRITDINNKNENGNKIFISKEYIEKSNLNSYLVKKGELVLSLTGAAGFNYFLWNSDDAYINQRTMKVSAKKAEDSFLVKLLEPLTHTTINKLGTGQNNNLSKEQMKDVEFLSPLPDEQQKVADCLISLDEVITGYEEKLKAIQSHKKGLMQNLFPQEGKTVPNYRFPEFENDGDWLEISLIDTADKNIKWSFTGGPFGSNLKASDYTSEGIRIIQLQNIGDGKFNDLYKIYTSVEKADELLSCNIYSGDIILSKMGDPVGRACIMPGESQRFVMASDGIRLAINEKKYSKYFIFSLINSDIVRTRIENKSTGSTRKRIGLDVLKKIPLLLPKKREEQQKIAECLSLVDELITQQINKIAHLKLHKKALMQGLFPKIE